MTTCPCRRDLLNKIYEVSFAVDDVKLYLDTHPWDEEALSYFREYSYKDSFYKDFELDEVESNEDKIVIRRINHKK